MFYIKDLAVDRENLSLQASWNDEERHVEYNLEGSITKRGLVNFTISSSEVLEEEKVFNGKIDELSTSIRGNWCYKGQERQKG